jgi:hypothetical protein
MSSSDSSSGSNNDSYNSVIELNADGSNEQEVFKNLMRICKSYHYTDVLAIADFAVSKKLNLRLSRELQLTIDENEALTKANETLLLDNKKSQMALRVEAFYREKMNEW